MDGRFPPPTNGERGAGRAPESRWIGLCTMTVPSGELAISDPMLVFDDLLWVALPPGSYGVSAKLVGQTNGRRVSRVRVLRGVSARVVRELGRVSVDFAQVGFSDRQVGRRAFLAWDDESGEAYVAALERFQLAGLVR